VPSRTVGVSAFVNLPLHHEVQKFSSGTGSSGWSRKKGHKMVVVVVVVQVLHSPILAALVHGTLAVGISQTLRRRTRNGITELSQRLPPIFGWAAITAHILVFVCGHAIHEIDELWQQISRIGIVRMGQNLVV